jgi:outer membrane protein TolC
MHPTLRRFEAEADSLRAQAEAARAGDAANVKVRAAYKHDRLESADSFTLGVGVPLTIHRKGRAEAAAAMLRAEAVMAGRAEADRRLREELAVLSATLDGAVLETKQIQDRLIPPAKKALDTVRAGLESGLYSQRDLTDTQAALAELRIRQVESLQAVHQLRAELERFASIEPGAAVRAPGGCSDPNCTGCRSHN